MKDKTHAMNRGYSAEEVDDGYDRLNPKDVQTSRERKNRQLGWAKLLDNENLAEVEGVNEGNQEQLFLGDGFIPRNNYEDRN